jgi:IS30 family transposase
LIPKGTDFDTVSDDDLAKYVDLINNRPRKRFNWLSPNQVFDMELNFVALKTGI